MAEDIEYLKFDKGPWLEQDDVAYHHMRMLWVFPLVWSVFFFSPTSKSKLDRGGSPSGELCHTNISQLQFVIVITDEYTKHLKWITQTSEHADWFWLPFVCGAFPNSTCRFPTLCYKLNLFLSLFFVVVVVLQRGGQTEGVHLDPHTYVSPGDFHRSTRLRWKILCL